MNLIALLILVVSYLCVVNAQTVQNILDDSRCSTAPLGGLSAQLAKSMSTPFSSLVGVPGLSLGAAVQAVPYLQSTALAAIKKAIAANSGKTLSLNSALRTIPQQVLLYEWFKQGKCGITAASTPGNSNHESGLAIDTSDYNAWKSYLEAAGCKWYGAGDVVHFTCPGTASPGDSVKAFQKLWNCNNQNDQIAVDGAYGTQTRARILKSPVNGFSKTC